MAASPWGGSEELWSRAALNLLAQGFSVAASVVDWLPLDQRVLNLQAHGIELWPRPTWYSRRKHPWRWFMSRHSSPILFEVERLFAARPPALVVFSDGGALPPIELLELCAAKRLPFVTIGQANWDAAWHPDNSAKRYRTALAKALRCFFVSHANRRLTERQIGGDLLNAEVVWNPVNVSIATSLSWPIFGETGEIRFASVGRLHPPSKGQDILLDALAGHAWRERPWRLYLYGNGPMQESLERLAQKLGLSERVVFAGFASVEDIWAANHVLVMPSRYEGLPLSMVEAMLCARPVIATDVAGHSEIVEDDVTGFLADCPSPSSVARALERFWARRDEAEEIGKAGARRIRELAPPDPVQVFSEKLKELAGLNRASHRAESQSL
jgi:glycosyltransferase involved in cell wall biosynthesis